MASKTFKVVVARQKIEFTLAFDLRGKPREQVFHCRPSIPAGIMLEFANLGDPDDPQSGAKAMAIIHELFKIAIVEEEYPIFEKLINDPEVSVGIDLYSEIAGWLAGEYTARPTGENSEGSQPAQLTGSGSTDGAPARVLNYSRSEQIVPVPS